MESIFDELQQAWKHGQFHPIENPLQGEKLHLLVDYYHSPLWLSDYEADERGELPMDLKRGILSQDGFYDFLTEIQGLA
jgi:hypothetical protein